MSSNFLFVFVVLYCISVSLQLVFKPVQFNNSLAVPRIVNGRPAKLGDVPYQIAFKKHIRGNAYRTFCGGIIIESRTILTAAHCFHAGTSLISSDCSGASKKVTGRKLKAYAVAGNLWNLAGHPGQKRWMYFRRQEQSDGQWRALAAGVYPNRYKFPQNDIALIWTRNPFHFNIYVVPIPIATIHKEYDSSMPCLASGYGRISETSKVLATELLLANLDIIPTQICNKMHRQNMRHFVCTSTAISNVAQGDSGGPLVCQKTGDPNDKGKGVVTGVVSGARLGVGSFFTRVSSYRNWIERGRATTNGKSNLCLLLTIYTTFCLL